MPGGARSDSRTKAIRAPSLEKAHLRVARAGRGAAGVHGLGAAAARIDQVELSFVEVEEARPVGRPDRRGLVVSPSGVSSWAPLPIRSDDEEPGALARHVAAETAAALVDEPEEGDRIARLDVRGRRRRPGCRSIRSGRRPRRSAAGVTAGRGLMIPEPAASAPPTIRTAATARSVNPGADRAPEAGPASSPGSWRGPGAGRRAPSRSRRPRRSTRRAGAASSSRSVIGLSLCRPHRWRRAGASTRSGDVTGPSPTGRRAAARCRRRSGRGSSAAPRRPGGRATAPRWRRR